MEYKALMLDVDGTLIPYNYDSLPSKKIKDCIEKVKNKVNISIVTGRSIKSTRKILKYLGITKGYSCVDGGAYVFDVKTEKPIYESYLSDKDIEIIIKVFSKEKVEFFSKDKNQRNSKIDKYIPYKIGKKLEEVTMIFTDEIFTLEESHKLLKKLSSPTMTVFRSKHKDPNLYGFNVTNIHATKLHGVQTIAKKLGVRKKEIIGVGDGYNDFPLLMASGLKVAMGNSVEDLKGIADYIAPNVSEDGVAEVIERFLLND